MNHNPNLVSLVDKFTGLSILVVGDVMLDRYYWGQAQRISPEAPVPVVHLQKRTSTPGGAANVAANLAKLGAQPTLAGLVGKDEAGRELAALLHELGVSSELLVNLPERPTTVKTRIIAQGQHIARLDEELTAPPGDPAIQSLTARLLTLLPTVAAVVFSDYAKGLLTPALLEVVISAARRLGKPVLVDPKGCDYVRYTGASLLTPNRKEAAQACGLDENGIGAVARAGRELLATLCIEGLLVTQGEDGMTLFLRDGQPVHLPTRARAVYDVTGAGDTVVATMGLALAAGAEWIEAAHLANAAAGLVVEKVGTTAVDKAALRQAVAEIELKIERLPPGS
jgi:D-beta-D-heptose 7-phosphate kinase/D-beta-D-heptose 1-phosphate adenosyltransferase